MSCTSKHNAATMRTAVLRMSDMDVWAASIQRRMSELGYEWGHFPCEHCHCDANGQPLASAECEVFPLGLQVAASHAHLGQPHR